MAGPSKNHHPFSTPQTKVTQHARKTGGHNGRTHDITPITKPRGPSTAVKIAENAKQGEKPLKAKVMPKIVHKSKPVRFP